MAKFMVTARWRSQNQLCTRSSKKLRRAALAERLHWAALEGRSDEVKSWKDGTESEVASGNGTRFVVLDVCRGADAGFPISFRCAFAVIRQTSTVPYP